jgi:hypothetical protein
MNKIKDEYLNKFIAECKTINRIEHNLECSVMFYKTRDYEKAKNIQRRLLNCLRALMITTTKGLHKKIFTNFQVQKIKQKH